MDVQSIGLEPENKAITSLPHSRVYPSLGQRHVRDILFMLVVLAMVVLVFLCTFLLRIYGQQQHLIREEAETLVLVQRLRFRMERQVAIERGYLITGSPAFRARLAFDPAINQIEGELAKRLTPDRSDTWREIVTEVASYEGDLEYLRHKRFSPQDGLEFFENVLRPRREELSSRLDQLVELETRNFDSKVASATESGRRFLWIGFALAGAFLVSLSIIAAFLRWAWAEIEKARARLESVVALRTRRLQRVVRQLEAFNYSVAHDLRAPARAVASFSELLLQKEARLEPDIRENLRRIMAAGIRMRSMLDGLLALSQLSQEHLAIESVDLSAMAMDIRDELVEQDGDRHIEFRIQKGMKAVGDARLFRVLLQNLMENSWKFTRTAESAKIEFGRELQEGVDVYFVRDNGLGFEPALADKLFQPFQRLPNAGGIPGLGIGLASAARIVEAHKGRLWAESRLGKGSKFLFTIGELP